MNTITPPRGLLGRFMPKVQVASFVYAKSNGEAAPRRVVISPADSLGNHVKGFDLDRRDWRTFKRENIVNGISLATKFVDTVSLDVRDGR